MKKSWDLDKEVKVIGIQDGVIKKKREETSVYLKGFY